jgi:glycosyltransferase involved in cell wall biosynthesis
LLAVEWAVNRAAARIVVPSSYIAEIVSGWQKVPLGKVDLVPYEFVAEKYAALRQSDVQRIREELGLAGRFAVGNFSRLHEEKGQRFLVRAMAEVRARPRCHPAGGRRGTGTGSAGASNQGDWARGQGPSPRVAA